MNQDQEHLRLLSVFHYVMGGITALCALFPVIHLVLGITILVAPERMGGGTPPPEALGWIFAIMGGVLIVAGFLLAGLILAVGRFLSQRRRYVYCLVVAGVECLFMPLGTLLGIFTIIVLMRQSVKAMFGAQAVPDVTSGGI